MAPRPERIAVLAHASVLDGTGYARRVLDVAVALRRALSGTAVTVATIESPSRLRDRAARTVVQAALDRADVGLRVLHAWPRRLGLARLSDRVAASAVRRLVVRDGIDALHAHGPRAARTALSAVAGTSALVVADVHGDRTAERRLDRGEPDEPSAAPDPEERDVVRAAHGAVFASPALSERFAAPGRPSAVVGCLVDDDRIPADDVAEARRRERRRAWGLSEDTWVAAYAGSLASWQEVPRLGRLAAHLVERVPQFRLLVLTPSRAAAARALERAGVPPKRFVVLSPPAHEVVDHLLAADAGVLLRRPALANRLAFPTKLAEYLAAGLEIVASEAVPVVVDALRGAPGLGRLVDWEKDDATWAARLAGASRPGSAAERALRRAFARERLAWSSAHASYRALYGALFPA